MKKLLNDPFKYVDEMLEGLCAAHPDLYRQTGEAGRVIARASEMSKGKVAGFVFVINLFDLGGCDNLLKKSYKVENLIDFPGH